MNRAIATRPASRPVAFESDPDVVNAYLEDAAHFPGGHAAALARPADVAEVAWVVQQSDTVLPVGTQSSLTGGATPSGGVILSSERLTDLRVEGDHVIAGAGVTLLALQDALAPSGFWFPPVPTFLGATVGGAIATNAAGAATFRYGPVRSWVEGLTIVLASGDVLRVARGQVRAEGGEFVIGASAGERRVAVPDIRMPQVPKCSAGYYSAPAMDLVDLFIGSEGTLGVIVEARLSRKRRPAGVCWVLVTLASEDAGIALAGDLRQQNVLTVAAIEHLDRRSMDILREDHVDRRLSIDLPVPAGVLLLAQIELTSHEAEHGFSEETLQQLGELLDKYGALESAEIVLPSDYRRAAAFVELREAVPASVNRRVAQAHAVDARVHKTAADMIVPVDYFPQMMQHCRELARDLNLDIAIWGHISDGNVHPNVIPRGYADVLRGRELILELARRVIAMGGSPLAEHGVGRHHVKQRLLEMLYGSDGVAAMRLVKQSLDPDWKLAPGLLFERTTLRDAG